MAAQPGGCTLIPDELDVLVARKAQGHDKRPGPPQFVVWVHEHGTGSKVHLDCLARCEVQATTGLWWFATSDVGQDAAHRGVAAAPALLALQSGKDGDTGDALLGPALNALTLGGQTGNSGAGTFGLVQRCGYALIFWHDCSGIKPVVLKPELTQAGRRASAHDARRCYLAV